MNIGHEDNELSLLKKRKEELSLLKKRKERNGMGEPA